MNCLHRNFILSNCLRQGLVSAIVLLMLTKFTSSGARATTAPGLDWEHVYPNPTGEWLTSVVSGPPGFVAVGSSGDILFSEDGWSWDLVRPGASVGAWLFAVCHAGDRYLAVGGSGTVLWSLDGRAWIRADTGISTSLRTCA